MFIIMKSRTNQRKNERTRSEWTSERKQSKATGISQSRIPAIYRSTFYCMSETAARKQLVPQHKTHRTKGKKGLGTHHQSNHSFHRTLPPSLLEDVERTNKFIGSQKSDPKVSIKVNQSKLVKSMQEEDDAVRRKERWGEED